MIIKKETLLGAAALYLLTATIAYAEVNVDLNIGVPTYVVPAPAYISPYPTYYDPAHRGRDWGYWREHHEPRREPRHDEHRHDEHR
jgi:hypothetical protein